MNLGHCLGDRHAVSGSAARDAIDIAHGKITLTARVPTESEMVTSAEAVLGTQRRPVYCYVGCLHPGLGTVGLVFDRSCADEFLQGISRCDSGGLAGGIGGFSFLPEDERIQALLELSFGGDALGAWREAFDVEVDTSYNCATDYAQGERPNIQLWTDVRARCITAVTQAIEDTPIELTQVDRRLWTWEARLDHGPDFMRLRCLVLSQSQTNDLHELDLEDLADIPAHVRIITDRNSEDGPAELFASLAVAEALVSI